MLLNVTLGVMSSLFAAGIVAQSWRLRQIGNLRKMRIFEPKDGRFNVRHYKYFNERIRAARDEIVVTGEGFEFRGSDGKEIAEEYHDATCHALQRGVHVTRIQTLSPLNPLWADKLRDLLREHPEKFHLYIVRNNSGLHDLASVCIIDASRRRNVVELALSVDDDLEDSAVRVASTTIFIHGRSDLAVALRANVMAMKHLEGIVMQIRNADDLANALAGA